MRIFTFTLGAIFGAYVAQNYDIGDVKTYTEQAINYIKSLEKDNRKP
tara:strand:- start:292 stop:432 length:141 start_codon:yes stop_codon:yes gene_type:complete